MATIFATRSQESLLNPPPPPHDVDDDDTREISQRSQRAAMRKLVYALAVCVQLIENLK